MLSFETDNDKGGIFPKCSRFNHACHPYSTCTYRWDKERQMLVVTMLTNVKAGTELTISYGGSSNMIQQHYGFWCDCPKCPSPADAAAEARYFRGSY